MNSAVCHCIAVVRTSSSGGGSIVNSLMSPPLNTMYWKVLSCGGTWRGASRSSVPKERTVRVRYGGEGMKSAMRKRRDDTPTAKIEGPTQQQQRAEK